ncbi:MAG: ABC transporter permease [Pseudomonadota bacterium]
MAITPVATQARMVWAIMAIFARAKAKESPLGVFTLVIEPLAMILIMTVIFSSIRMRVPQLGDYIMLFFMTAVVPVSAFRGSAQQGVAVLNRLRTKLVLPQLRPLDLFIGAAILNFLVVTSLFLGMTAVFVVVYKIELPITFPATLLYLACNSVIGLGVGIMNAVVRTWFPFWLTIFGFMSMPIMFLSGMFYLAESLPTSAQNILYYNPFLHSTEITRTYYFPNFSSDFFDPHYYFGWVLGTLFIGLLVERYFRYRLMWVK